MRQAWTNRILHLTSFIYRKKQALLTEHGWKTIITVWQLIFAQIGLAIISLPLAIVAKPAKGKASIQGTEQYTVRRVLTLTVVAMIASLWLLKLGVVLFGVWHASSFSIEHIKTVAAPETTSAYLTTVIAAAPEDSNLTPPALREVSRSATGVLVVNGVAEANADVLLYVMEASGSTPSTKVYLGKAGTDGAFTMTEDQGRFSLPSGDYVVQAFSYGMENGWKSPPSTPVHMTVRDSWIEAMITHADQVLNIATAIVLVAGVLLTILVL